MPPPPANKTQSAPIDGLTVSGQSVQSMTKSVAASKASAPASLTSLRVPTKQPRPTHRQRERNSGARPSTRKSEPGDGEEDEDEMNESEGESEGEEDEDEGENELERSSEEEDEGDEPLKRQSHHPHRSFQRHSGGGELSPASSSESVVSEDSVASHEPYEFSDQASEESVDRAERRYLIGTHSFLHLKDPGLETALDPEEPPPEKEYRGRKAERHNYEQLCNELGVQPLKAFLEQMRGDVMDLRNYGLGPNDIAAICKILCENKHVDTLLLSGNFAGQVGGEAIAEMIEKNMYITHLDIGGMMIQPAMKKICDAIKINLVLESVDLSMDELTDQEMPYIAEFLQENITLRELFLQHNKITDAGLAQLALGFVKNKKKEEATGNETLALIDLGWNRIKGGQLAGPFFEAIANHPNVKFFNLAGNSLDNAKGVTRVLGKNKNLEIMSIAYNRIPGKACPAIGKALAFTPSPLKNFVAGPNLWRQKQAAQMILPLTASKSMVPLETLDMSQGMCVGRKFLKSKRKVWKEKPELEILHSGNSYGTTKVKPVDGQEVTIKRANTVCENFATPLEMLIDELRTEPKWMTQEAFKKFIKSCDLYKDKVLTETFFKFFPRGNFAVDCEAIITVYDRVFPKAGGRKSRKASQESLEEEEEVEEEGEGEEVGVIGH